MLSIVIGVQGHVEVGVDDEHLESTWQ